jgi:hypothetical protein
MSPALYLFIGSEVGLLNLVVKTDETPNKFFCRVGCLRTWDSESGVSFFLFQKVVFLREVVLKVLITMYVLNVGFFCSAMKTQPFVPRKKTIICLDASPPLSPLNAGTLCQPGGPPKTLSSHFMTPGCEIFPHEKEGNTANHLYEYIYCIFSG